MSVLTSPGKLIHIFNGFRTPYSGREQEALTLHRQLREHRDVELWAIFIARPPDADEAGSYPPRRLTSVTDSQCGTYIFVGAHWRNKL